MNQYDVHALAYVLHQVAQAEIAFMLLKMTGYASKTPEGVYLDRAEQAMEFADNFFQAYPLADGEITDECKKAIAAAKHQWGRPCIDNSAACEIFHRLQNDIVEALKSKVFLRVSQDRSGLIDQDKLFGDHVHDAFPSSNADIKQAGNCLAAECNTAAVFHLMRASEIALRALARDRNVVFPSKPISQQEWGTILGALEGIIKQMRLDDAKKWAKPQFREAQIRFYNGVVQEFRSFNEAWRRHISHANPQAFYDRDQAQDILNHVEAFMRKLSTRISETAMTPEYWNTE